MRPRSRAISVPPAAKRITKKDTVLRYAAARGWMEIGEQEWRELRTALPGISPSTIRTCGLLVQAPWSGVAAHSIEDLDASLHEFTRVYESRPDLRRLCREEVIAAKERARFAARNSKLDANKRGLKHEMLEWMLVWLDDPAVFPIWAQLRLDIIGGKNAIH
jgi:hypothetical protein